MNNPIGYLTRIHIDETCLRKKKLTDIYQWHQYIWTLFSCNQEREFLFNINDKQSPIKILIFSKSIPELPIDMKYDIKPISESYFDHTTFAFDLTCNPTVKKVVRLEDGSRKKNGSRLAIIDQDNCLKWLENKSKISGFKILNIKDFSYEIKTFFKDNQKGKIASVTIVGSLEIVDKSLFIQSFCKGIGTAKGFGFGLIQIIPI